MLDTDIEKQNHEGLVTAVAQPAVNPPARLAKRTELSLVAHLLQLSPHSLSSEEVVRSLPPLRNNLRISESEVGREVFLKSLPLVSCRPSFRGLAVEA